MTVGTEAVTVRFVASDESPLSLTTVTAYIPVGILFGIINEREVPFDVILSDKYTPVPLNTTVLLEAEKFVPTTLTVDPTVTEIGFIEEIVGVGAVTTRETALLAPFPLSAVIVYEPEPRDFGNVTGSETPFGERNIPEYA